MIMQNIKLKSNVRTGVFNGVPFSEFQPTTRVILCSFSKNSFKIERHSRAFPYMQFWKTPAIACTCSDESFDPDYNSTKDLYVPNLPHIYFENAIICLGHEACFCKTFESRIAYFWNSTFLFAQDHRGMSIQEFHYWGQDKSLPTQGRFDFNCLLSYNQLSAGFWPRTSSLDQQTKHEERSRAIRAHYGEPEPSGIWDRPG